MISRVPDHRAIVPAAQLQLKRFGEKTALPAELRPAEDVLKTARAVLCAGGRPDEIHGLVRGGQAVRNVAPLLWVTGNLVDRFSRKLGTGQPNVTTSRAELEIRVQRLPGNTPVFAGSEHHQKLAGIQFHVGEYPAAGPPLVIRQRPPAEVHRIAPRVLQLDPIDRLAVLVSQPGLVGCLELVDHHATRPVIGIHGVRPTAAREGVRLGCPVGDTVCARPGDVHLASRNFFKHHLPRAGGKTGHAFRHLAVDANVLHSEVVDWLVEKQAEPLEPTHRGAGGWHYLRQYRGYVVNHTVTPQFSRGRDECVGRPTEILDPVVGLPRQHHLAIVGVLKLERPLGTLPIDRDGRLAVQPQLTPVDAAHRLAELQRDAVELIELTRLRRKVHETRGKGVLEDADQLDIDQKIAARQAKVESLDNNGVRPVFQKKPGITNLERLELAGLVRAGSQLRSGTARRVGPGHQLAVDPHEEPVVEVDQQIEHTESADVASLECPSQINSGVAAGHVRQDRAALPVAVAERRGTAWPSAVIEVRGPPVAGRLRALEVAPVRAALEQHLRLAKRLAKQGDRHQQE